MRKLKDFITNFFKQYRHIWILSYFAIYLVWFNYLEKMVTTHFHVIHVPIDDYIPFCEYFVIPYIMWFGYVAWGITYTALHNKNDFYRLCGFLFTGMTIFLIVSTLYPNGQYLRPYYFSHHNLCTTLCEWLYSTDTPTNLFPSVHVFNSIAVNIAVWHSDNFKKNKAVRYGSAVLMVLIILSTMFLKQHSVFDVVTGMVLAVFMYSVVYTTNWAAVTVAKPVRKPGQI